MVSLLTLCRQMDFVKKSSMVGFMTVVYLGCGPTAANAISPVSKLRVKGAVTRAIEILDVEHLEDHRLRIIFNAQEHDGLLRFPISTIDRAMVKVDFTNTSTAPEGVQSLLLHGAGGDALRRALYISVSLHRKLKAKEVEELRLQTGELVKGIPAEYLTVAAISQDSARVIANVSPENGDNTNRILQQLQSLEPEGEGPSLADTLCVAAERFHAWNLAPFKKSDQKILIIISSPGDGPSTERYRGQNCWRSLLDQGVRVFDIAFGQPYGKSNFDLSTVAQESGGYVHRIVGLVEMNAAVKNIMALLKNEYVVDVNAPDIALEDQPLELKIRISYHDEIFESPNYNVGFVIPSLSAVFAPRALTPEEKMAEEKKSAAKTFSERLTLFGWIVALVAFMGWVARVAYRSAVARSKTVACNSCGNRVQKDHSNCPFRSVDSVARLVVVGGIYAGQTISIARGETMLARYPSGGAAAKIRGRGISWWSHGKIQLDGYKALYTPKKLGRDRINGWPVNEPRLLGVGSILQLGNQTVRFEVKKSANAG